MKLPSKRVVGIGLSVLSVLFLAMDAGMKLARLEPAIAATGQLGFSADTTQILGLVLGLAVALYAVPLTSVLGALLLTAYLGGAVAVHLQHGSPLLTHVFFGVYVGAMVWTGLWLRNPSLRTLLPVDSPRESTW